MEQFLAHYNLEYALSGVIYSVGELAVIGLGMLFLTILTPTHRTLTFDMVTRRPELRLDMTYMIVTAALIGPAIFAIGDDIHQWIAGNISFYPLAFTQDWPFIWQALLCIFLGDGIYYLEHRALHWRPFWPFHAIHHSPKHIDWITTYRFHPGDSLLNVPLQGFILYMLGFSLEMVALNATFRFLHSAFIHATIFWNFGKLKYILVSPLHHRMHHSLHIPGKNYAGVFAIFDVLGGTYYDSTTSYYPDFGIDEPGFPDNRYISQLLWPFTVFARYLKQTYRRLRRAV